ncbi:MAG: hypothetical protein E7215_13735 [Clostridium sulfidigenes]|uniref:Uncharacterized protein n=1 Tax=Clostridium sulfidigenes TaxID=318464 RepID=A0A927ZJW0_9CLOT|nr:hypothetical protein [Clostridium sulfidigenes]
MDNKYEIEYEQDYEKYYFEYRDKYKSDTCVINSIRKLDYERNRLIELENEIKRGVMDTSELVSIIALFTSMMSLMIAKDSNEIGIIIIIGYAVFALVYRRRSNAKYNKKVLEINNKIKSVDLRIIALKNLMYEKHKVIV